VHKCACVHVVANQSPNVKFSRAYSPSSEWASRRKRHGIASEDSRHTIRLQTAGHLDRGRRASAILPFSIPPRRKVSRLTSGEARHCVVLCNSISARGR
jgi:hypothetical protein